MDFFRKKYKLTEPKEENPKIALYKKIIEDYEKRIRDIDELSPANDYENVKKVMRGKIEEYRKKIERLRNGKKN